MKAGLNIIPLFVLSSYDCNTSIFIKQRKTNLNLNLKNDQIECIILI